ASPILFDVPLGAAENRAHDPSKNAASSCGPLVSWPHKPSYVTGWPAERRCACRVASTRRRRDCLNSRETTDHRGHRGRQLSTPRNRTRRSTGRAEHSHSSASSHGTGSRGGTPRPITRRGCGGEHVLGQPEPGRSLSSSATPYRRLIKPRSSQLHSLCSPPWTSFRRYRVAIGGCPIPYPGFAVTKNRFACSLKRRSSIDSIWFATNVDERGTVKSVVQYFEEIYGFTIHNMTWPCLQVGNPQSPNYLPMETVDHNAYNEDPYAEEFGIKISEKLALVEACLNYHDTGREKDCLPRAGQRNMMNKIFSPEPVLCLLCARPDQVERALKAHFHVAIISILQPDGKELNLVIIILPDNNGPLYGDLKRICETDIGLVSQCCLAKHVFRMSEQYLADVALKINVKVVASRDWPEVTKYAGLVCAQPHRQESIQDLFKVWQDPQRGTVTGGMGLLWILRSATLPRLSSTCAAMPGIQCRLHMMPIWLHSVPRFPWSRRHRTVVKWQAERPDKEPVLVDHAARGFPAIKPLRHGVEGEERRALLLRNTVVSSCCELICAFDAP
ncbi:hypothetical protein MUK42_34091, partial [Musa troglodytarum]